MTDEELKDEIADTIKNMLGSNLDGFDNCKIIKDNITAYLLGINSRLGWYNSPEVEVENQGPFTTVNFFDQEGNRLETLDDMLAYMGEPCQN